MKNFIIFLSLLILAFGCTDKETIFEDQHVIEVIEGNEPPPYSGVTTVQLNNYINKVFIDLIGREPNSSELQNIADLLRSDNISNQAVDQFLNSIMSTNDYYNRLNDIYFGAMLNSTDSTDIAFRLEVMTVQLAATTDPLEQFYFQNEIIKLTNLQSAKDEYQSGEIGINDYMSRIVNNFFYDQINMGTENFVLACFENFFKRLPTEEELESSITMVNGFPAQLLFTDGATKDSFIGILTDNDEYYQGLGIDVYVQLLARNPDSPEMGEAMNNLSQGVWTYQELQKEIIKSEEYKGF